MTPRQALAALAALENVRFDAETFAKWAKVAYTPTKKDQEALARLQAHLIDLADSGP